MLPAQYKSFKLSSFPIIFFVLLIVSLLPLWLFEYFPSQDGPSHLYNARVFTDYSEPESYTIRQIYEFRRELLPNLACYGILGLLMKFFSPLTSEKLMLSLFVIGFPLSLLYFLNQVNKKNAVLALLGFILVYNRLLHLGFYNFCLSIPLFFFALGYWWNCRIDLRPINVALLYLFFVALYFCHFVSFALLVLSICVLGTLTLLYVKNENECDEGKSFIMKHRGLYALMRFHLTMSPVYLFTFFYYLSKSRGSNRVFAKFYKLCIYYFNCKILVVFTHDNYFVGCLLFLLILALLVYTIIIRAGQMKSFFARSSSLKSFFRQTDQFLFLSIIMTILFFGLPWASAGGAGWINERIYLYIIPLLLPFLEVDFSRYGKKALVLAIIVLLACQIGYVCRDYSYLNKEIKDMVSSAHMITDHSIVEMISSDRSKLETSDYLGELPYVSPFLHVPCYYCLGTDIVFLSNYEADCQYFPIAFKGGQR